MISASSTFRLHSVVLASLIASAGAAMPAQAQTRFDRFYDSASATNERASSVEQTNDRGYIMVGTRSLPSGANVVYAVKTDPFGAVSWSKSYGVPGGGTALGFCVRQTRDTGYIIAGHSNGRGLLMKLDNAGNIQWQRAFAGPLDADPLRGPVVREVAGNAGGYVVVGSVYLPNQNNQFAGLLLRTDAAGNMIDQQYYFDGRYGPTGSVFFRDVRQDGPRSFIITGKTVNPNGGSEALVFKTLPNSPLQAGVVPVYGPPTDQLEGESVEVTSGGGYAFTGHRLATTNTILFKTTNLLAPVFNRQFNGLDTAYSLRESAFYQLVSTGISPNVGIPMFSASTLMRNGVNGAFHWAYQYPFGGQKDASQGVPTQDGGYMLAGGTAFGPNPINVSGIKTNAAGEACERTPLQPAQPQWQPVINSTDLLRFPLDIYNPTQLVAVPDQPRTDFTCLIPGCTPPPANMVFWAPFDNPLPFRDLAGGGNGVSFGGPTSTPGYVNQSFCFNSGVTPFIDYPNSAAKNFNAGNFSFDAWVRRPNTNGQPLNDGVRVIVDKRTQFQNGTIRGYSFYLFNGSIACQVATGAFVNYGSGPAGLVPSDGQWHHVAVTIDRTSTMPTVLFYVDGAQAGAGVPVSPANIGLSVNCPSALRIGGRIAAGPLLGSTFQDCIDEVELFNRVLRPAEIAGLYQAQSAGKCREFAHLPVVAMCPTDASINISATLCNFTTTPQTYTYSVQGLPVGPGSTIAGPSFTPAVYPPVVVNPGNCVPVTVTVPRPVGLANGLTAAWQMCFGSTTGASFCATGTIVGSNQICWINPNGGFGWTTRVGTVTPISVRAVNESSSPVDSPLRIRVIGPDMEPDVQAVSLNGLPPGEPVIGRLSVRPGGTSEVSFDALIVEGGQDNVYRQYTIVIEGDLDGDGQFEPLVGCDLSDDTPPPPPPCTADFNNDGTANSQDFFDFLAAFFALDASADVNHDGLLNSQDFFDYLNAFFRGC